VKTVRTRAVGFELYCPECGEVIYSPTGSVFWLRDEIEIPEYKCRCVYCEKYFRKPTI